MIRIFSAITIVFLLSSCLNQGAKRIEKAAKEKAEKDSIMVIQKPFANDPQKIEYEIPVLKGTQLRQGMQKRFYAHGSVYSEIPYTRNVRQGTAYTYYKAFNGETPKVWKEQPYVDGKLHGLCRRYFESGALQAEYEYREGLPAIGLKEYNESGKLMPQADLTLVSTNTKQYFYITASLSKKVGKVNYFTGELVDGKYMPLEMKKVQERDGVAELLIPRDGPSSVCIVAVYSTRLTNQCILAKTIRLK